jgi:hypothetical protein
MLIGGRKFDADQFVGGVGELFGQIEFVSGGSG